MTTASRYLIYGLIDPRDRYLRYIGKTHKRRELRLAEHIDLARSGRRSHVYNWIRDVLADGMTPEVFVLQRIAGHEDWRLAERRLIAFWRDPIDIEFPYIHPPQTAKSTPTQIAGARLTNVHRGGD